MFNVLKKSMESDMEKVMLPLILKSGDTNKFLREDCNVALDAIVENCSPQKLILIVTAELVICFYIEHLIFFKDTFKDRNIRWSTVFPHIKPSLE